MAREPGWMEVMRRKTSLAPRQSFLREEPRR